MQVACIVFMVLAVIECLALGGGHYMFEEPHIQRIPIWACSVQVIGVATIDDMDKFCQPITILIDVAAASGVFSAVGIAFFLILCALPRFGFALNLAVLVGAELFVTLSTLQGAVALVAVGWFCDIYLQKMRDGIPESQRDMVDLRLLGPYGMVFAGGYLGIVSAVLSFFDAVARVCTRGGGGGSNRAKTGFPDQTSNGDTGGGGMGGVTISTTEPRASLGPNPFLTVSDAGV